MAHFAKIDNSGIVLLVTVGKDSDDEIELSLRTGDTYRKTSYNSRGGVHYLPDSDIPSGQPHLRYNYAGIGFTYDEVRDAFIPPKPYDSWVLNENTCLWEAPVPYPNDNKWYYWNEQIQDWVLMEME